ncbi:hypothetical protein BsWGS_03633 [Bradybaena similaris]
MKNWGGCLHAKISSYSPYHVALVHRPKCLSTAFYFVYNQPFLMHIFLHDMKPNFFSSLFLLVFPCLSFPPTFLLTQHIQVFPFSSHGQKMQIIFFCCGLPVLFENSSLKASSLYLFYVHSIVIILL